MECLRQRGLAGGLISQEEYAQILDSIASRKMPPQHTRLGGEIYIHGRGMGKGGTSESDWTRGCIALDDADMQHLYDRVALGTPVSINA